MRSMIISLVFFSVTVTAVCINSYFVTSRLENIAIRLEELPSVSSSDTDLSDISKNTEEILHNWNNNRLLFSVSINMAEIRDCTVALEELCAYCASNSPADYNAALAQSKQKIATILQRERFSLTNII